MGAQEFAKGTNDCVIEVELCHTEKQRGICLESWAKGRRPGVGHYIDTLLRYLTHTFLGHKFARYVHFGIQKGVGIQFHLHEGELVVDRFCFRFFGSVAVLSHFCSPSLSPSTRDELLQKVTPYGALETSGILSK